MWQLSFGLWDGVQGHVWTLQPIRYIFINYQPIKVENNIKWRITGQYLLFANERIFWANSSNWNVYFLCVANRIWTRKFWPILSNMAPIACRQDFCFDSHHKKGVLKIFFFHIYTLNRRKSLFKKFIKILTLKLLL